ncbi:hypothetical protein AAC387_Pa05g3891 [Persea americana]
MTSPLGNETDRLALLHLKNEITGDPFQIISSWNDSLHFCQWKGVICGPKHDHVQRVKALKLRGHSLAGTISAHIENLTFLTSIDLSNNTFHGGIPKEIGHLFRLQHLDLSQNSLQGQVPASLTHSSNLRSIILCYNLLDGNIPDELSSLLKLRELHLDSNNLTGSIPPSLGNLSTLAQLSLGYNNLHGRIPDDIGRLTNLVLFQVGDNRLSGVIPAPLLNLSSLMYFAAAENKLQGSIPADFGLALPNLKVVYLGANLFSGPIPASISNASGLSDLDLTENNFSGPVPSSLGTLHDLTLLGLGDSRLGGLQGGVDFDFLTCLINCSYLEVLTLSGNQFTGELPVSVTNLSSHLKQLRLERNHVRGSIPAGIDRLADLTLLCMEENTLTGTIPTGIGKLYKLGSLDLSGNRLTGQVPSSIGNLTQLTSLRLGGNGLEGSIPSILGNCQKLNELDLSDNNLNGTIPTQIFRISSLSIFLDLSKNSFNGSLPLDIGHLMSLTELDVSMNDLTGEIPSMLGECSSLVSLYLDENHFQGAIPPSLDSLRGVQHLGLSCNNLSGLIPQYLEEFPFLQYFNLSFNDFEGEVPKRGVFANASAISVVGNKKLCGGNPMLLLPMCSKEKQKDLHFLVITVPLVGMIVLSVLLSSMYVTFSTARTLRKNPSSRSAVNYQFPKVSYADLLKATNSFSSANLIGLGSHGFVYKGNLFYPKKVVAVKVINLMQHRASKSFTAECEALWNIRHRNLVKILTACSSVDYKGNNFKALVYEYMPNGSLDKWLRPDVDDDRSESRILSLLQRINIAIDVASALDYLHHHCHTTIVHCDIKPSNILLDDDMNAHVGDFGLARLLFEGTNNFHQVQTCSIEMRGSIGYIPPEYGISGYISTYGDVYSYGILVLEMFTGKKPTDGMFKDDISLHLLAKGSLPEHVMDIVDPQLLSEAITCEKNCNKEKDGLHDCLVSVMRIGVSCSESSPIERMDVADVVMKLHSIRESYHKTVNREKLGA